MQPGNAPSSQGKACTKICRAVFEKAAGEGRERNEQLPEILPRLQENVTLKSLPVLLTLLPSDFY